MIDFRELRRNKQKLIYLLSDPREDSILCYVGQTNSASRFASHMARTFDEQLNDASAKAKAIWIADLRDAGLDFLIYPLEICDNSVAHLREWEWIGRMEVSPFHILTNSIIDRAIGAAVVGDLSFPSPPAIKRNCLTFIKGLTEVYAHFSNRGEPPPNVVTGYKLLREKVPLTVSGEEFLAATLSTSTDFWKLRLGEVNWRILSKGATGSYVADEVHPDTHAPFVVELTSYVPWALTQQGVTSPDQIRTQSCLQIVSLEESHRHQSSVSDKLPSKPAMQGHPLEQADLQSKVRPSLRPSIASDAVPKSPHAVSGAKTVLPKLPSSEPTMNSSEATLRKLERWSTRINDPSSDVRKEAAEVLTALASEDPTLAEKCVHSLQQYIHENRYSDLFWALSAVTELPNRVIWKSSQLVVTVATAPLAEELDAVRVGEFFLKLTESNELAKREELLKLVVERAKFALSLEHHGGRRDFMKVVDWAEDNGLEV